MTKLPKPPAEPERIASLDGLAPRFRAAVERMLAEMRAAGFKPVVYESLRTNERQAWLHGFGRTWDDGRGKVTQVATAEYGWHLYGLAVDIVCAKTGWDDPKFFRALGAAAKDEGLEWGGSWPMRDMPHVQFGHPMRRSPSARAVELRRAGGNEAVWKAVGAA